MDNRDKKSGLMDVIPAAIVTAVCVFMAIISVNIVCSILDVSLDAAVITYCVIIVGIGFVAGAYQHMVNEHDVTIAQLGSDIANITNSERTMRTLVNDLSAQCTRLGEEIERHEAIAKASATVDLISLETIEEFARLAARLHVMRQKRGVPDIYSVIGDMQDHAVIALIKHLAKCVPVEREAFAHLGPIGEQWNKDALDNFFLPCRDVLPSILRELAAKKNGPFIEAVQSLPSDVEIYLSRLTLTHEAEQPAAS